MLSLGQVLLLMASAYMAKPRGRLFGYRHSSKSRVCPQQLGLARPGGSYRHDLPDSSSQPSLRHETDLLAARVGTIIVIEVFLSVAFRLRYISRVFRIRSEIRVPVRGVGIDVRHADLAIYPAIDEQNPAGSHARFGDLFADGLEAPPGRFFGDRVDCGLQDLQVLVCRCRSHC
ncbi:hypothetical protein BDW74DRAFT_65309 [Aspergillus multicolor]|uniref:uncharacterized protein n=1 Tax=Aspergillus multicolor TaxID=41759 RepID=UPI003CCDE1BE